MEKLDLRKQYKDGGDPRRADPAKLKTVLRQAVERA